MDNGSSAAGDGLNSRGILTTVMTQFSANHVNPDLPGTAFPLFYCVDSLVYPVIYYYIVMCV